MHKGWAGNKLVPVPAPLDEKMEASTQQTAFPVSDGELVGAADGGQRWVGCRQARLRHERRVSFPGSVPSSGLAWRKLFSYTAFPNVIFLFKLFYLQKYKKVL